MTNDKLELRYYTELLPRVNLLSVCIEIKAETISSIGIQNNSEIIVNGAHKILLPIKYPDVPNLLPHVKKLGDDCVSLRFNANTGLSDLGSMQDPINTLTNSKYKWSNSELESIKANGKDSELQCWNCNTSLISLKDVRKFNAMPSEIWAEMMEFWHCHKPSDNDKLSTPINRYTVLKPARASIIVGSYYFLVNPDDNYRLTKTRIDNGDQAQEIVCCDSCKFHIGEVDKEHGNVYRLKKWNTLLQTVSSDDIVEIEKFHPFIHAYSSILDSVSSTAFRIYMLRSETDKETQDTKALIWVFNFGLSISLPSGVYENSLKLMFTQDSNEINNFLQQRKESKTGINNEIDILYYPAVVIDDLLKRLNQFNGELPVQSQKMNFWKVSYLPSDL